MRYGRCVRLQSGGMSTRKIARRIGVATARLALRVAWSIEAALLDATITRRLLANASKSGTIGATKNRIGDEA
jgi:hypothetical protein